MTPKEKAIELVNKMHIKTDVIFVMSKVQAKQCALIAVDLAIQVETNIFKGKVYNSYWEKVKKEIEKL